MVISLTPGLTLVNTLVLQIKGAGQDGASGGAQELAEIREPAVRDPAHPDVNLLDAELLDQLVHLRKQHELEEDTTANETQRSNHTIFEHIGNIGTCSL